MGKPAVASRLCRTYRSRMYRISEILCTYLGRHSAARPSRPRHVTMYHTCTYTRGSRT
jgi:hypothetical protein